MTENVTCIVHHEPRDVGLVGKHLAALGVPFDIRQPNAGDPLPDPDEVSRAIVFGGAMSANDDHDPAIRSELTWIEGLLARGTPVVGICLGAQMIARALDARVRRHARGRWEIGYRSVVPTSEGATVFGNCSTFYQWHQDGFDLPAGAARLAGGTEFPEQAYRIGDDVYGFQFHPEVEHEQLLSWHRDFARDMAQPGADSLETQRADDAVHRAGTEEWVRSFVSDWCAHTSQAGKQSRATV